MKIFLGLFFTFLLSSCAGKESLGQESAPAQVGIVNHTDKYIYSAAVNGSGGGHMPAQSAGIANICCTSIPLIWHPNMKVLVRWNMPEGSKDVIREKMVEIEKYERPGSIYLHFFPDDEVRVVVSWVGPRNLAHPIPPPLSDDEDK
jgi:hypothetical protein